MASSSIRLLRGFLGDFWAIFNTIELPPRDIGGSDPERMAAPRVAEYVREMFKGTAVKVEVMEGQANFEKNYPCLAAVNRAANQVPRHQVC